MRQHLEVNLLEARELPDGVLAWFTARGVEDTVMLVLNDKEART